MTERGFYSLIQFMPNPGRAEAANVGIVLVCPDSGAVIVRMSETNAGPKLRFGSAAVDDVRLGYAKDAIRNRIYREIAPTPESIETLRAIEGNALALTAPRAVRVDILERTADELFDELVHVPDREATRVLPPDMAPLTERLLNRKVPIERPKEITVPVTDEVVRVALAYQNGVRNLVSPQGFSAARESALDQAKKLGAQGHLLSVHLPDTKLIVVAKFGNDKFERTVAQVLKDLGVRMFSESSIPELENEIVANAHE